jgi:hypothetical protein
VLATIWQHFFWVSQLFLAGGCPLKGASMLALIAKEIKQEYP